ncbi:MAG: efflux RND transporter periplasmic adaptor subunit [Candidatus Pacebacteria bacterium]|nr:efflux RND transporter periplasmic adaptor subunit [Candidatus Paceibacterota bacterium]
MTSFLQKTKAFVARHKVWTFIIVVVIIGGAYYFIQKTRAGETTTTYALSTVTKGTVITTVTGTGQVSANNQAVVDAQVAGTIDAIDVSVGQKVVTGQTLAHINSTSAQQALQSAQIAYNQLVQPPTTESLTNTQDSVAQSYNSAFNSVASTFTDLQTIMPGIDSTLYGQTGFLSDQHSSYLTTTGQSYRDTAGQEFDKANAEYQTVLLEYKGVSLSSATSSISQLVNDTQTLASNVVKTLKDTQNTITFIVQSQPSYDPKDVATAESDVTGWLGQATADDSSLVSTQNSIITNNNSLATLVTGADSLQIQAQQLSLSEAEQNYAYENVVAPFDGTVALISATPAEQISNGAAVATVVTTNEYATISLNEVDAAKVSVGQKATLTFDAINNLSIAGTVSEVDGVGTVSQGVVTYNVKIAFDTEDSRVKPGMSVNAAIITAADQNVLIVPSAAVKTQGTASYVQELGQKYSAAQEAAGVTSSSSPRNVPVTVGLSDNTNTEIDSGLSVGDQVIIKTTVTTGTAVAATKSTATAATTRTGGGGYGGGGGASVLRGL